MTLDVNLELAGLLFDLVHVAGEKNPRAFGYKRAAKAVLRLDRQITPLVTANTFRAIPGIGPSRLHAILEVCHTATGAFSAPLAFLRTIPGMTAAAATAVATGSVEGSFPLSPG